MLEFHSGDEVSSIRWREQFYDNDSNEISTSVRKKMVRLAKVIKLFLRAVTTFLNQFEDFRNSFDWIIIRWADFLLFSLLSDFLSRQENRFHIFITANWCHNVLSQVVHKHLCTFIYAITKFKVFHLSQLTYQSSRFSFIFRLHRPYCWIDFFLLLLCSIWQITKKYRISAKEMASHGYRKMIARFIKI